MKLTVALAADDQFAAPLGITIYSIIKNASAQDVLDIFVLDCGITEENRQKIRSLFAGTRHQVTFLTCDLTSLKTVPMRDHWSIAIFARLFLPHLLPHTQRVLYLDSDVLVRGSLSELFELDMRDALIAGVKDWALWALYKFQPRQLDSFYVNEDFVKMFARVDYFNAGVLLMNLDLARKENLTEKCLHFIAQHQNELRFFDQDAINFVCADKRKILPLRFNMPPFLNEQEVPAALQQEFRQTKGQCVIVHYLSKYKPWLYGYNWGRKEEYLAYMAHTPWPRPWSRWTAWQRAKRIFRYWFIHPACLFKPSFWHNATASQWEGLFLE